MKVLILQLTRLGDIFCSIPALKLLKAENPEWNLHLCVRGRYASAAWKSSGLCDVVDRLKVFDTSFVLSPFLNEQDDGAIWNARDNLIEFVNHLRAERYDKVINLSFSPFSSYLTHLIAGETTPTRGYTRTSDYYLHIPDLPSQYFHSQVGLGKSNRLHVMDILSWVAGCKNLPNFEVKPEGKGIVIHVGASQSHKSWPMENWRQLSEMIIQATDQNVTLVGAEADRFEVEKVFKNKSPRVRNMVGRLSIRRLKDTIQSSRVFVGCDSGPLHVANLVGCPSVNLSLGQVRFWETGPVVPGSRVLVSPNREKLEPDQVFEQIIGVFEKTTPEFGCVLVTSNKGVHYQTLPQSGSPKDNWPLVEWLYFDGPRVEFTGDMATALDQIRNLMVVAHHHVLGLKSGKDLDHHGKMLNEIDDVLRSYSQIFVLLRPLVDAFVTSKGNILPMEQEKVFAETLKCYHWLHDKISELMAREPELPKGAEL